MALALIGHTLSKQPGANHRKHGESTVQTEECLWHGVQMVVRRKREEGLADGLTTPPLFLPVQPHLPADKARGAPGSEQQHLLTAAPSSSSSSLESSASAVDRRAPSRSQLQAPGPKKASGSGEARASSGSSGKKRWEPTWLHPPLCISPFLLSWASPAGSLVGRGLSSWPGVQSPT